MTKQPNQYVGEWWTPEYPDAKVVGTLSHSLTSGLNLKLVVNGSRSAPAGTLAAIAHPSAFWSNRVDRLLVHGQARSGTIFTLFDGFVRGTRWGMGGISEATLFFNRGLKGVWTTEPESLPIERIKMRYPGMDAWLNVRAFDFKIEPESHDFTITQKLAEDKVFAIDENRRAVLTWARKGPAGPAVQTRISVSVLPCFAIEYTNPVPVTDALADEHILGQLLTILFGAPTAPRRTRVQSPVCRHELEGETYMPHLSPLGAHDALPKTFRKWTVRDVLIPFGKCEHEFEQIVQRWFRMRATSPGPINSYIGTMIRPSGWSNIRLFDLAATAESLHAHLRPDEVNFSEKEAEQLYKTLRTHIPTERRGAVKQALSRVHHLTYRERLDQLIARFPGLAEDVIGDTAAQERWCTLVTRLRNNQAHRRPGVEDSRVGGSGYVRLAAKIRVFIDAWLLAEAGLSESVIEQCMRDNREYWHYGAYRSSPWDVAQVDAL